MQGFPGTELSRESDGVTECARVKPVIARAMRRGVLASRSSPATKSR